MCQDEIIAQCPACGNRRPLRPFVDLASLLLCLPCAHDLGKSVEQAQERLEHLDRRRLQVRELAAQAGAQLRKARL